MQFQGSFPLVSADHAVLFPNEFLSYFPSTGHWVEASRGSLISNKFLANIRWSRQFNFQLLPV